MTPSQFDILLQRLIAMETPKVVVFLVILVWHLDIPKPPQEYQFLEFYAGVGRIATLAKWCGFATAAVDIRYGAHRQREGKRRPMDINGNAGLVLCIHLLLTSQWEQLVAFFAIVCSSYVPVNRHSTGRTLLTPLGNEHFIGVRRSNKMTSRTVILIWITILSGGTYLMENPHGSFLAFHPRYVWMLKKLEAVGILTYKTAFWMRKYGSISWKRTWVWANSRRIGSLDLGPLTEEEKEGCEETTIRYEDAQGKIRWKGNSNLKLTQQYTFKFAGTVTRLLPKIREDTRSQKFPAKDASLASALQGALFVPSDEPCVEDPYLPPVEVEDQPSEMGPLDDPYFVGGVDNSTAEEVSQECLDPMMQHIASLGSKLPDEVRTILNVALPLLLNQPWKPKGLRVMLALRMSLGTILCAYLVQDVWYFCTGRDKYEKHIELFWVEKKMAGRKRKREIFEEDEELSESEYDKLKNADSNMPDNMGLDTDDTGHGFYTARAWERLAGGDEGSLSEWAAPFYKVHDGT
ncbi:Uncharacterized protein SCF082_LOCUS6032 [Durusdinium trenchii]|uniref:Uncharacterized protein n=2 Tax=Durusdinium trenchii TaxID=1381693 RepID=A0ABP0IA17_9DINO